MKWIFRNKMKREKENRNITIVPTLKDEIDENAIWCATFKLVWNDFQYEILKNDFEIEETNQSLNNLISDTLGEEVLSKEDYYKIAAQATVDLKRRIEEELDLKFNEKSEMLDNIKFDKDEKNANILLYTILKKTFWFEHKFCELAKGSFGNSESIVEYFGLDNNSSEKKDIMNQIKVLFYNSNTDFSVKLNTKSKDNIILYRTNDSNNFENTFNTIIQKSNNNLNNNFNYMDTLRIPNLSFNVLKNYDEVRNKIFKRKMDKEEYSISEAMQLIKFKLDKTGGEVKSEAYISARIGAAYIPDEKIPEPRNFNFDDTFYLFLIEEGKEKPYMAIRIQDIENFIN